MGLFGNRTSAPQGEAELLMTSMILVIAADGDIDDAEVSTVLGLSAQFPAFAGKDVVKVYEKCIDEVVKNGYEKSISNMNTATVSIKQKAFMAAVECAYASEDVNDDEAEVLEAMAAKLGLDNSFAEKAIEIFSIKYGA